MHDYIALGTYHHPMPFIKLLHKITTYVKVEEGRTCLDSPSVESAQTSRPHKQPVPQMPHVCTVSPTALRLTGKTHMQPLTC